MIEAVVFANAQSSIDSDKFVSLMGVLNGAFNYNTLGINFLLK